MRAYARRGREEGGIRGVGLWKIFSRSASGRQGFTTEHLPFDMPVGVTAARLPTGTFRSRPVASVR